MKKLSPIQQEAKLKVLQDCMDDMDGMMGESLDGKKKMKATVVASSKKGLEEGLEKASEVISEDEEESEDEEMHAESDADESDELSEEEIDAKIKELMAKKKSKSPSVV